MENFKKKIKNLKKLPLDKAFKKVITKSCEAPYLQFRRQLIQNVPIDIDDSHFLQFASKCSFFYDTEDKKILLQKSKELNVKEDIIIDAEKICSHTFNLLGSGNVVLGDFLPWNKDFKTNFIWENKFYKDIKVVDLSNNSDVKVPWELSRFQHFFTLGKAYWLTDDEKYVTEFKSEIEDWIEKNPVEMSVNWTCTMDVGIRAANWIAAYFFFKESKSLGKEFWTMFNKSLYLHGRFIYKNLENKGDLTGNHYLSNIVGLVWLGLYFGSFTVNDLKRKNNPEKWLEFGLKELENEMFVQNNSDGTNYEASTSYHRLVTELYLLTTLLCNKNYVYFTKEYMKRLEKMCKFIMNITKPNGLSPIIGDADDGRLLIISSYSNWLRNDFRHLLGIAGEMFNRNDFRYYGENYHEDTLWIYQKYIAQIEEPELLTSNAFKDGGYYILRNNRIYCSIRCGELSFRGEGVHSHNDQLSFELNIDGEDFIVDSGSYVYSSDYKMRNLFRSTVMHNTVQITEYEQNDFEEKNLFHMKEQTNSKCLIFQKDMFIGEHYGFLGKCDVTHKRIVSINENELILTDQLLNKVNNNSAFVALHLAPDVICEVKENKILLNKNKVVIEINDIEKAFVENSYISQSYGIKIKNQKILIPIDKYIEIKFMLSIK